MKLIVVLLILAVSGVTSAKTVTRGVQKVECFMGYTTLKQGIPDDYNQVFHFEEEYEEEENDIGDVWRYMEGPVRRQVHVAQDIYVDFRYTINSVLSENGWRYGADISALFYSWDKETGKKKAMVKGYDSNRLSRGGHRRDTRASLALLENFEITQHRMRPDFKTVGDSLSEGTLREGIPQYFRISCFLDI